MSPLISIIIPVYNSENFIGDCIKSVLVQNFDKKEYEIIIIDDCSTDKTFNLCRKYKKKYSSIKLIKNNKNYGVSFTRNKAVNIAKGKYIMFIDSDDLLEKKSLKKIFKKIKENNPDFIMSLQMSQMEKKKYFKKILSTNKSTKSLLNFLKKRKRNYSYYPWNFILKKDFLKKHEISFNKNIKIFEDQIFTAKVLCLGNSYDINDKSYHLKRERFGSLNKLQGDVAMSSCLQTIVDLSKLLKVKNLSKDKKVFLNQRIDFMLKYLKLYILSGNKNTYMYVYNFIKKNINVLQLVKSKSLDKFQFNKRFNKLYNDLTNFYNNRNLTYKIVKEKNFSNVCIYGLGILGRTLCQIYKKNNIKNIMLFDSNKDFINKKYLGLNIYDPFYIIKKKIKKQLIVLSFDDRLLMRNLKKKINGYNLSNSKVISLNWKKIIGNHF